MRIDEPQATTMQRIAIALAIAVATGVLGSAGYNLYQAGRQLAVLVGPGDTAASVAAPARSSEIVAVLDGGGAESRGAFVEQPAEVLAMDSALDAGFTDEPDLHAATAELLHDPDPEVRGEAAAVLDLWSADANATSDNLDDEVAAMRLTPP